MSPDSDRIAVARTLPFVPGYRVEALVGALHQATVETSHLCQQFADRHAVIRALPTQASLGR